MQCSKKSLSWVSVATIALFASLSQYTSSDPTWRDTPEGLLGSVLRGGSLGFSDYLSSDLKHRTEGFAHRNPATSTLAIIAGAVGGTMLGSTEEALAGQGLKSAAKYLVPSVAADKAAQGLVSSVPLVSKLSSTIVPSALSGALQGGTYAYNTASDTDPDPVGKALLGATLGGVGTGVLGGAERLVGPTLRAILGVGSAVAQHQPLMNAARDTAIADTAALVESAQALTAKYLGDTLPGSLKDFIDRAEAHRSEVTKPLYYIADNASIDLAAHPDLLNHYVIGDDFARFLGKDMHASGVSPGNSAEANRFLVDRAQAVSAAEEAVKGLDREQVGLDAYDSAYTKALLGHATDNNLNLSIPRPLISRYLDDLAASRTPISQAHSNLQPNDYGEVDRLVDSTKPAIGEDSLPGSLSDFIDNAAAHRSEVTKPLYDIADNASIDLAGHPDLLENYVLDPDYARYLVKAASDPATAPSYVRDINRFLENRAGVVSAGNDVLKSYRNVLISDQELNAVHSAAINNHIARSGADFSLPRPLVRKYLDDLAYSRTRFNDTDALTRSLEKGGGANRFDDEATNEYIAANDKLRAEAKAAGQPDNSRPLTRYVLDEAIQKKVQLDPSKTPQAILDTINDVVKPRLYAVYGREPVDALIRDATMHAQLINNRREVVAMCVASEDGGVVHRNTDKSMAEFLQQHPEEAIAHIKAYMLKHPEGKLPDYEKYLSSVLGSLAGSTANDGVTADPGPSLKWDRVSRQMVDRVTGLPPRATTAHSTGPKWRWDRVSRHMVRVR